MQTNLSLFLPELGREINRHNKINFHVVKFKSHISHMHSSLPGGIRIFLQAYPFLSRLNIKFLVMKCISFMVPQISYDKSMLYTLMPIWTNNTTNK
jgi:hypothetical protein